MCTAATYKTKDFYFGRTLDYEFSYGDEIIITPRNYPFVFRHTKTLENHYALIGMACCADNYPLYYDAINEKGLGMAGLNFVGNAHYQPLSDSEENIASFEFIPWILGQCATVKEVRSFLGRINLCDTPFSDQFPSSSLHWLIADRSESITVECVADGMKIYDNPVGVLTNNPPFDMQLFQLNNYMQLSAKSPENHFSDKLNLNTYILFNFSLLLLIPTTPTLKQPLYFIPPIPTNIILYSTYKSLKPPNKNLTIHPLYSLSHYSPSPHTSLTPPTKKHKNTHPPSSQFTFQTTPPLHHHHSPPPYPKSHPNPPHISIPLHQPNNPHPLSPHTTPSPFPPHPKTPYSQNQPISPTSPLPSFPQPTKPTPLPPPPLQNTQYPILNILPPPLPLTPPLSLTPLT